MFSTLRYTADSSKEAVCIEQASNPPGQSHGQQHSACNHCRAKKLKCIGENNSSGDRKKTGSCDRCRSKGIECVFPEPSPAKGSKRRRSSQSSKDTQKSRGTSYSSSTSVSTTASTPPPMEKPRAMTIKTNPNDVKSLSGSVPMDGVVNFDLGANNEFMDLLDMVNPDAGTDENRPQFDFSSLGSLPDEFLGFDFDSDSADKWPALTTAGDGSYDFYSRQRDTGEFMANSACVVNPTVSNNKDDIAMLSSTVSPMHLSSPDSPIRMQQLLTDPIPSFRPTAAPINSPASTTSATTPTTTPTTTKSKLSSAFPGSIVAQRNREAANNMIRHTSSHSTASSCRCMSTALDILEVLEIKNSKISLEAIDGILSFKKRALNQCNVMLECQGCNSHSQFMMLLVVICDKMVASFERLSLSCREVHQQMHIDPSTLGNQQSQCPIQGTTNNNTKKSTEGFTIVDGKPLFVGEYEVDLDEERCYLVRQLVMLQLRNLATFELRLKGIANGWSWDAHKTMLATIDKRLQDTAANIRRLDAGSSATTRMVMA
ncbi:MAG: hypothetical protein Q9166_008125 [cf. Caloplaca sp. 2 TL-2023]